jgi:hypothetical protein
VDSNSLVSTCSVDCNICAFPPDGGGIALRVSTVRDELAGAHPIHRMSTSIVSIIQYPIRENSQSLVVSLVMEDQGLTELKYLSTIGTSSLPISLAFDMTSKLGAYLHYA